MKERILKLGLLFFTILFMLTMPACNPATGTSVQNNEKTTADTSSSTENTNKNEHNAIESSTIRENDRVFLQTSSFPDLLEEDGNYQVFSSEQIGGYYYKVLDNNGYIMEEGFLSWHFLSIKRIDDDLLLLKVGNGGALASVKMYDVEGGRISRFFPGMLGHNGDLVAYFDVDEDGLSLIVRDMFDAEEYYCKITDESLIGPVFSVTTCKAEFDKENTSITVTYPNEEGNMITKTFPLKNERGKTGDGLREP